VLHFPLDAMAALVLLLSAPSEGTFQTMAVFFFPTSSDLHLQKW